MDKKVIGVLLITVVVIGTADLFGSDNRDLVAAGNKAAQAKVFNIRSYGAIGDGVAMETEAIQRTIDACHAAGGGIVWIPAGDFQIGTIWLKSNITLSLDHGASLLGSHDIADYKTGCRVSSNTAPLKVGTSSRGGFIDVSVTNCYFYSSPMGAIKLQLVDGGRLENVDISRIVMEDVGNPIFIRLGNRGRSYTKRTGPKRDADVKPQEARVGTLRNVRIRNIVAEVAGDDKSRSGPIMITGIPGHYVEDVVLENIKISYPGGGAQEDAQRVVPEDIVRYPEQFFFGVLPAWGAYIRHARNVEFRNVILKTRSSDERRRTVLDDVEGFSESSLNRKQTQ